jgi:hypothetical protein
MSQFEKQDVPALDSLGQNGPDAPRWGRARAARRRLEVPNNTAV